MQATASRCSRRPRPPVTCSRPKVFPAPKHSNACSPTSACKLALKDSVLWVDEAGLVSVPDMAKLFDLAERLNARVILSGDPQQHGSVARGDALRIIAERAGIRPANVNEIVRQKGTYKEAVQALANGNVAHGWELLKQMGAIHELPDETRIDRLATDYLDAVEGNRTVLVVSPTHAEKDLITAAIRTELQSAGRLGEARTFTVWRELQWTEAQKSDPIRYMPGQWVRFTQNAAGIVKGAKLEVIGRDDDNQVLARNANGETVALPLAKAANFKVYARIREILRRRRSRAHHRERPHAQRHVRQRRDP